MNLYTQLEVLRFDRIAFAHSLSAADYRYSLDNQGYGLYGKTPENGGVLEVGFVEQNSLLLRTDAGEFVLEENSIFIIPPNCSFSAQVLQPGLHRHTSVEFLLCCRSEAVSDFQPPEGQKITLPLLIPPTQGSNELFAMIRALACAQPERSYFEQCADFMLLLSKLSQLAWSNACADAVSPGNRRYCSRAKAYVAENIHRRLTVGEIAAAIGISKNYLTNLFKSSEGISLKEYINRRKLSHMLELMRRYGYTLAQAGAKVGFDDSNYISRIFRHYFGTTVTEYRRRLEQE